MEAWWLVGVVDAVVLGLGQAVEVEASDRVVAQPVEEWAPVVRLVVGQEEVAEFVVDPFGWEGEYAGSVVDEAVVGGHGGGAFVAVAEPLAAGDGCE